MRLPVLILLVLVVWSVKAAPDTTDGDVLVPRETLRFMLGCQADRSLGVPNAPLPVFHTDIDTETGTTSQKVTLLDTDQLKQSLRGSVHSDEVLELIIGQLNAAVQGAAAANAADNTNRLRHDGLIHDSNSTADDKECTINNNIDISVPAQEVDNFNDRVQMLIQQNSFLLLEQINTLFTYKLRSLREDFEGMVKDRTKKINRKLDAVLKALGTTPPVVEEEVEEELAPPSVSEATTGTSSEVETSTDAPGVPEEEEETGKEEEEEETTTEETTNESSKDQIYSTRNTALRPVPSNRPVRPLRNRYQQKQPIRTVTSRPAPTRSSSKTSGIRPERPARPERPESARPERPERAPVNRSRQQFLQRRLGLMRRRPSKTNNNEPSETLE